MSNPKDNAPAAARTAFYSPWMDTTTAAQYLVASPKTLRQWRCQGRGPRYRAVGGRLIRYHVDDLDAFARGEANR